MSKYLITVVCLTFNNHEEFSETIYSIVRAATSVEHLIEVVVIDSSTDLIYSSNIKLIKTEFTSSLSFKCFIVPPSGIFNAMNYALEHSSGLYVNFMNSGDIFSDQFNLSQITSLISQQSVDSSSDLDPYLFYGRTLIQSCISPLNYLNPPSSVFPNIRLFWNYVVPPGHQACFFLRSWHLLNLYFPRGHGSDRPIIKRSLSKAVFVDTVICHFRLSGSSSMNNLKPKDFLGYFLAIRSPLVKLGFWPKLLIKYLFGDKWEYIRFLRLFLLRFILF